jgi:hypothetical protein
MPLAAMVCGWGRSSSKQGAEWFRGDPLHRFGFRAAPGFGWQQDR